MHGATPRPGRVVIWDSSILRLTRPPSVSFKQGQVLLHITYSKSQQKMIDEHEKWVAFWNEKIEVKKTWYLPEYKEQEGKPLVPNVADHVVANYSTLRVSTHHISKQLDLIMFEFSREAQSCSSS